MKISEIIMEANTDADFDTVWRKFTQDSQTDPEDYNYYTNNKNYAGAKTIFLSNLQKGPEDAIIKHRREVTKSASAQGNTRQPSWRNQQNTQQPAGKKAKEPAAEPEKPEAPEKPANTGGSIGLNVVSDLEKQFDNDPFAAVGSLKDKIKHAFNRGKSFSGDTFSRKK